MSSHLFHPRDEKITIRFDHYEGEHKPFTVFKIQYLNDEISLFFHQENLTTFLQTLVKSVIPEISKNKEILTQLFNQNSDKNEDL